MSARAARVASSVLLSTALIVWGAGCGGGSKSTSSASSSGASATSSASTASSSSSGSAAGGGTRTSGSSVVATARALHASLRAENHSPKAGKPWRYSVRATDAAGHPVDGTVDTEFAFGSQVVGRETPPTHKLTHGRLNDNVTFPSRSVGYPLTFRVVVHTHLGSATLDWPIMVAR